MSHYDFPDGAFSHRNDDTSITAAAQYQRSGKLTKDQMEVLNTIRTYTNMTAGEMAEYATYLSQVQICRRRKELEQPGPPWHPLIAKAYRKRTVFEKTGAWVYEITQAGIDFLKQHQKA